MLFKHIYEKTLAQASYLIGCQKTREAIVIDPRRDNELKNEDVHFNSLPSILTTDLKKTPTIILFLM